MVLEKPKSTSVPKNWSTPMVAVGGEELLGADEAEGVVEVGGHEVLATFAAGEGKHGDACALAAGEVGKQAAVLVVGVGDDEHERGAGAELAEELLQGGGAVIDGETVGERWGGDALAGEVGGVVELLGGQRAGCGEDKQGCGDGDGAMGGLGHGWACVNDSVFDVPGGMRVRCIPRQTPWDRV